jgi:poly-gamma-glutamate biosynthesis protein PgsC/CapC
MHNYGVSPEDVRMALAIGLIVSILVYERWRVTGGAAVVAAYLALFVERPGYLLTTVVISVATYYIVERFIARRMFLYGRRRLVVMVLVGMTLQLLTGLVAFLVSGQAPWLAGLYGIGFVLPGLIAQDIERQGLKPTLLTVVGTTLLTFLLFHNVLAIKENLPVFWNSIAFEDKTIVYSYHTALLIPAAILSVVVSALLFEWTALRSGGFLTAAYAALFVLQPLHLAFIVGVGALVFFFVTRFLMRRTPIFGRTKFAMMVLTALVFTWALEVSLAQATRNTFIPFAGFSIISPMIAALIANDSERQGLRRTLWGLALSTAVVFIAIKGVDLLLLG